MHSYNIQADNNIIHRTRIYSLLENKKIVIVEGKPGQGKTVLVQEYLDKNNLPFSWFDVPPDLDSIDDFIKNIVDTAKSSEIIIDHFENLNLDNQSVKILCNLFQKLPEEANFFLISSKKVSFLLTAEIDRRDIRIIDDNILDVTSQEISRIAKLYPNIYFSDKSLLLINEFIEGWMTALIFILEKFSEHSEQANSDFKHILDENLYDELKYYFEKRIENFLNADERMILITAGFQKEIPLELIHKMFGVEGENLFDKLDENYFFTHKKKDGNSIIYVIHNVFRMYLHETFTELNAEKKETVLKKIIDFNYKKKNYYNTIKYLIMNKNEEEAEQLFSQYGETLLENEDYLKISKILESFNCIKIDSRPVIKYFKTMINIYNHPKNSTAELLSLIPYFMKEKQHSKVYSICIALLASSFYYQKDKKESLEIMKKTETFLKSKIDLPKQKKDTLKTLLSLGRLSCDLQNNHKNSIRIALEAEEAAISVNNTEALIYAQLVLAKIYLCRGFFSQAEKLLVSMYKSKSTGIKSNILKSIICFYLSDSHFYQGKLLQAVHVVDESLNINGNNSDFDYFLLINITIYHLYMEDIGNVNEFIVKLDDKFTSDYNHYAQYAYYTVKMLYAYRTNNRNRVQYYLKKLSSNENGSLIETYYPSCYLDLIEINIFLENYETATQIALNLMNNLNEESYPYTLATNYAFLGYLNYTSDKKDASKKWFDKMEQGILDKGFTNLYIVSPKLMLKIVEISKKSCFDNFYRIEVNKNNFYKYSRNLNVKTLGSFRCFNDGKEIDTLSILRQKKLRDLFFLLLTYRDTGIQKSDIYNLFWPHYTAESARDNLNTTLYRLRKIIDPQSKIIISDPDSIKLDHAYIITDVEQFMRTIEKGKLAEQKRQFSAALMFYEKALILYKGNFLNECNDIDRVIAEREFIYTKQKQIIFNISKIYLKNRNVEQAHENLKSLIKQSPLSEPAYRLLMICQALAGNRGEIINIFNNIKRLLQKELEIDVDSRTYDLKNTLLNSSCNIDYEIEKEILL